VVFHARFKAFLVSIFAFPISSYLVARALFKAGRDAVDGDRRRGASTLRPVEMSNRLLRINSPHGRRLRGFL
jgi:hypothetical protein